MCSKVRVIIPLSDLHCFSTLTDALILSSLQKVSTDKRRPKLLCIPPISVICMRMLRLMQKQEIGNGSVSSFHSRGSYIVYFTFANCSQDP